MTVEHHTAMRLYPLSVFMLYFTEIVTLLVVDTNRYYHWAMDRLDNGPSPQPDVTEAKMFVFLTITIQMKWCLRDQLTDCWAETDQFYTPFYTNTIRQNRYLHIAWFSQQS
jgi:hypothetical protein